MDDLFDRTKMKIFWPSKTQEPKERVLATMRFVIYLSVILFIIRRDPRILLLAGGVLFILYMMYTNGMVKPSYFPNVIPEGPPSTENNFMNNPLMKNYPMGPNTGIPSNADEEWSKVHPFREGKHWSQMNFFKMPNNNLEDFLKDGYTDMFTPRCRDDTSFCEPEMRTEFIQSRGPPRRNNGIY
jgi:hypothetical protein